MVWNLSVVLSIMMVGLIGCDAERPTKATPISVERVTDYRLDSFSPASGSTLMMGDTVFITGYYTKGEEDSSANLWTGYGWERDDGATYITTISGGEEHGKSPYIRGTSIKLSSKNRFHDFSKGYTVTPIFLVGSKNFMRNDTTINWGGVKYHWRLSVWWWVK